MGFKYQERVGGPLLRVDEMPSPPSTDYAAMIVDYWPESRVRSIPFDLTCSVTQRTRSGISDLAGEDSLLVGEPGPSLAIIPVPEDSWGARASERPTDLLEVVSGSESPIFNPVLTPYCEVILAKPAETASYDIDFWSCRDGEGNELLGRRPARSALSNGYVAVFCDRYPRDMWCNSRAGMDVAPLRHGIRFDPPPSATTLGLECEGVVRVKVIDSLQLDVVDNVVMDGKTTYKVGPVSLFLGRDRDGRNIHLYCRGDFGLIRELEFLGGDGTLLHREVRARPHLYWSDTCMALVKVFDRIDEVKQLRVRYCDKYHHYVVPFKVTMLLKKQD